MRYTIEISEEQRAILEAALRASHPGPYSDDDEATILRELIQDLPECETADPGIVHSLCC